MSDIQKDLVLSINEYAFVLDKTKGNVTCWVGPIKTSLSTSDELVYFNQKTKAFEPCFNYDEAIHLFVTAPENWYIVLKNPVENNRHPTPGTANSLPEKVQIGKKVNIIGPTTFALYPGQMCKVIQGHSLKVNQYLLARVYDAESANDSRPVIYDKEGKIVDSNDKYTPGQQIIIKGTDVSFYIPPTGIEIVKDPMTDSYIREAVTLERLEYCILKNENGQKRYEHGPKVVFPSPAESFVQNKSKDFIFKAIELSPISGIYVKVIAEYEENGITYSVGQELFITGNEQMIYYPRPEHAIINYDGKFIHHAIAIPKGEGRYIMNRLTGEIKTIVGPLMYLPDPRKEVVIKRKLSEKECALWFPDNEEALNYNLSLSEKFVEKLMSKKAIPTYNEVYSTKDVLLTNSCVNPLDASFLSTGSNISRGTSYTKPRTVTLDTKYDGVVNINVWKGYAVEIIKKDGTSRVVKGPQTVLLDYDETLAIFINCAGKEEVYLPYKNENVSCSVVGRSAEGVELKVDFSFDICFDEELMTEWFLVKDYFSCIQKEIKYLIRTSLKEYDIDLILTEIDDIINEALESYVCSNNESIFITNVTFNDIFIRDSKYNTLLKNSNDEIINNKLSLITERQKFKVNTELYEIFQEDNELRLRNELADIQREQKLAEEKHNKELCLKLQENERKKLETEAQNELQPLIDAIEESSRNRILKREQDRIAIKKANVEIDKDKEQSYADQVVKIISAISPDLAASLEHKSNEEILKAIASAVSPYSMANDESVATTASTLLRGTGLQDILKDITK